MFGFLRGLWGKAPGSDFYRPRERTIYRYWDGQRNVAADPMTLYRKVMEVGPELKIDLTVADSPSKDAGEAHMRAVDKLKAIFSVKGLAEGGLTEAEMLDLLDHFMSFCEALKKNSRTPPTCAGATPGTTGASSGGGCPTPSTSACGSTASGPATAPPAPSPTGPGPVPGS